MSKLVTLELKRKGNYSRLFLYKEDIDSFRSPQKYSQRLKYGKGENEQVRHSLFNVKFSDGTR